MKKFLKIFLGILFLALLVARSSSSGTKPAP